MGEIKSNIKFMFFSEPDIVAKDFAECVDMDGSQYPQ